MKLTSTPPKQLLDKSKRLFVFAQRYRVLILFILVATTIGYTTVTSQSFLAPNRNEKVYEEKLTSLSNFKTIDRKFADELKKSSNDVEITIDQLLPDNRTNPFTE